MAGGTKDLGRFDSSFIYLNGMAIGHFQHLRRKSLDILAGLQYSWINNPLVWYFLGVFCPASAVAHATLLGGHCRSSHAEVSRQCEADMSRKSMPRH